MSQIDDYRALSSTALPRVFMSLGLPPESFTSPGSGDPRPFDAVLNADASQPDTLWLFKGSDFFHYDLLSDRLLSGPHPIKDSWTSLPGLFQSGIQSAVWCGPVAPNLWTFFVDEMYVSLDISQGWAPFEGPRGVLGAWATGVWTNADGSWRTPGLPTALHGLGAKYDGTVHFFKDGQYVRHDLRTGHLVAGPMPVAQEWNLPEPFLSRIDHAFYGTGAHEEHINFISGDDYALYDFRTRTVLDRRPVAKRFPVFAQFVGRPQVFLAEDYTLDTLVGPVSLGRLIDTRSIGAGSTIEKILVTETTDSSKHSLTRSVLDSQDTAVTTDLFDKLDEHTGSDQDSESYKYQLAAQFHGEAHANSLWGGEVNAQLGVQGQTDTLRSHLSQAAFKSVSSQVQETQRATEQKTYNSQDEIESTAHVLKKEIFTETNSGDTVRVYEFYEQLQAYVTLLSLHQVVVAYSDGISQARVVQLPAVRELLADVLVSAEDIDEVVAFLRQELEKIVGQDGQVHSLLADSAPGGLALVRDLTSAYVVVRPDGSNQTIPMSGVITAARSWVEPTFTITCVQR